MIPATAELIHSRKDIERALDRLAKALNRDLAGQKPVVLAVMIGGMVPAGHLITRLECDLELDYIHVTRYQGDTKGRTIQWLAKPRLSLRDRPVLLVDDILDVGHTLVAAISYCQEQGARSVTTAVLVEKLLTAVTRIWLWITSVCRFRTDTCSVTEWTIVNDCGSCPTSMP